MNPLATVVCIVEVRPHPNADNLELVDPDGSTVNWAIAQKGTFQPGDRVVWIDSMNDPIVPVSKFPEIAGRAKNKEKYRVRAQRIRGLVSRGLVKPWTPEMGESDEGVCQYLGITKWEPPPSGHAGGSMAPGLQDRGPDHLLPSTKYDVEGLAAKHRRVRPSAMVTVTEKIHGTNAACGWLEGTFRVRSRGMWKKESGGGTWWAVLGPLRDRLARYPNLLIYGEIFGQNVQDMDYGQSGLSFRIFDVWDVGSKRWYTFEETICFSQEVGIPLVPVLGKVIWPAGGGIPSTILELAEGPTTLGAPHTREGVVIRWDGEMAPGMPSWWFAEVYPDEVGGTQEEIDARCAVRWAAESRDPANLSRLGLLDAEGYLSPAGHVLITGNKMGRTILKLVGQGYALR